MERDQDLGQHHRQHQSPKYDGDAAYLGNAAVTPIHRRLPSNHSRSVSINGSVNGSGSGSGSPPPVDTPSLLSSPSVASSLNLSTNGLGSPLRNQLFRPDGGDDEGEEEEEKEKEAGAVVDAEATAATEATVATTRTERFALASRLHQLARQLTDGDGVDEAALMSQVEHLEAALVRTPQRPQQLQFQTPQPRRRPVSLDMRAYPQSHSHQQQHHFRASSISDLGSVFSSPAPPSLFRSRFSDLSLSLLRDRERERERDDEVDAEVRAEKERARAALEARRRSENSSPSRGSTMTVEQANKIVAEALKLNEELGQMVENLKARQEESDHIHSLLIERAERAAQRIMFLQNRISYLEEELQENDDELQHLRICLKALEIQMPPHPDQELQRCFAVFKDDYKALKRKRLNRSSLNASVASIDSSVLDSFKTDSFKMDTASPSR